MLSIASGSLDLVKLLDSGANTEAADNQGSTSLMAASGGGFADTVKLLLEHGAKLDAKSRDGSTALTLAESHGKTDVAAFLRQRGVH